MTLLLALACSAPSRLATIEGATRLTELANGELLVGTADGELWQVSSFGDASVLARLPGERVEDLVADPMGSFWVRTAGGNVYQASPWTEPVLVASSASLLQRGCESTDWQLRESGASELSAASLALNSCDTWIEGTRNGLVDGVAVSSAAVMRVQATADGVAWVDANRRAGCRGCTSAVPNEGVVDALFLHLAPFVYGEAIWVDQGGSLWLAPG